MQALAPIKPAAEPQEHTLTLARVHLHAQQTFLSQDPHPSTRDTPAAGRRPS
jgi:hypothetical protein